MFFQKISDSRKKPGGQTVCIDAQGKHLETVSLIFSHGSFKIGFKDFDLHIMLDQPFPIPGCLWRNRPGHEHLSHLVLQLLYPLGYGRLGDIQLL